MGDQQFCLKWNNYALSVTSVFKDLLEQEQLCDVTLSTQDKNIKAHRIVLTACSNFFKKIFNDVNPYQHPVVFLKDMKYEDLRGIIEFIYNGEVSIDQTSLSSFLMAAESLKIKGLTEETQRCQAPSKKADNTKEAVPRTKSEQNCVDREGRPEEPSEDMEEGNFEIDEEEEEALTEQEIKNSSLDNILETQCVEDKFDGDDVYMNTSGGGLQLDPSLTIPPGTNPAILGAKKTCPYCFQQLSWHALSRHIRDMHKAKSDLVNCQYCFKTFRNKNSLGCHIWRFHKRGREPKTALPDPASTFTPTLI